MNLKVNFKPDAAAVLPAEVDMLELVLPEIMRLMIEIEAEQEAALEAVLNK